MVTTYDLTRFRHRAIEGLTRDIDSLEPPTLLNLPAAAVARTRIGSRLVAEPSAVCVGRRCGNSCVVCRRRVEDFSQVSRAPVLLVAIHYDIHGLRHSNSRVCAA